MKKFINLLSLVVIFLFTTNCSKESINELAGINSKNSAQFKTSFVNSNEILDILEVIDIGNAETGIAWSNEKSTKAKFFVKREAIAKVVDSVENITYSFEIIQKVDDPAVLYNLVATKRTDGSNIKPFIMKYEFTNGQNKYSYAVQEVREFKGKVSVYSINEFQSVLNLAGNGDSLDPCYKDIGPADDPTSDDTNGSGSGTTGGASSGGSSGGDTKTEGSTSWAPTSGYDGGSGSGYVEVGEGSFGEFGTEGNMQKGYYSFKEGDSDCPEDVDLLIPINQQIEKLCGSYNFMKIGESYQANFGGLGIRFQELHGGTLIDRDVFIKNLCVAVPDNWTSSAYLNTHFAKIYNDALGDLMLLMNVAQVYMSDTTVAETLLGLIVININKHFIDAHDVTGRNGYVTPAPCVGAPYNEANWCPLF